MALREKKQEIALPVRVPRDPAFSVWARPYEKTVESKAKRTKGGDGQR